MIKCIDEVGVIGSRKGDTERTEGRDIVPLAIHTERIHGREVAPCYEGVQRTKHILDEGHLAIRICFQSHSPRSIRVLIWYHGHLC